MYGEDTLVKDDVHDGSLVATEQAVLHKVEDQPFLVSLIRAEGIARVLGATA